MGNADSAAAQLMKSRGSSWVIGCADRITANGDVANKIGTYQLAVLAMHHGVRFMVVAASSTIDMALENGEEIQIEERAGSELLEVDRSEEHTSELQSLMRISYAVFCLKKKKKKNQRTKHN